MRGGLERGVDGQGEPREVNDLVDTFKVHPAAVATVLSQSSTRSAQTTPLRSRHRLDCARGCLKATADEGRVCLQKPVTSGNTAGAIATKPGTVRAFFPPSPSSRWPRRRRRRRRHRLLVNEGGAAATMIARFRLPGIHLHTHQCRRSAFRRRGAAAATTTDCDYDDDDDGGGELATGWRW